MIASFILIAAVLATSHILPEQQTSKASEPVPKPAAGRMASRVACNTLFTLWKDADPDIPILKEAKAEYSKLQ